MTFEINVSDSVDEDYWNRNLQRDSASTIYQIPSYTNIYNHAFDSKPIFIAIKKNNELVGQLSALVHTKYYWRNTNLFSKTLGTKLNLNSILSWNYGPIIHDKSNDSIIIEKILSTIDKLSLKYGVSIIQGSTSPLSSYSVEKDFKSKGYSEKIWSTYLINLNTSIDDLYNSLKKETRYDIRKSESFGFEFEVVNKKSSFDEYMEMAFNVQTIRGEQRKKQSVLYEQFWKSLYENGNLKIFLARHNGELLAGIDAMIFNNNIIQYGVANSPNSQSLVGSFLTWNTIKWAISNKLSVFDMGGANPYPKDQKEKLIDFYKSKWGGTKQMYSKYSKILKSGNAKFSSLLNNPSRFLKLR